MQSCFLGLLADSSLNFFKQGEQNGHDELQELQGLACGVADDERTDEISQEGQDSLPLAVLGHSKGTGQVEDG